MLPKTVCLVCINSLNQAFDFVVAVERAQRVLTHVISSLSIKKEITLDSENCNESEPPDTMDFVEIKIEDTAINQPATDAENLVTKGINLIEPSTKPVSQLMLTWNEFTWTCPHCETQFPTVTELRDHSIEYHKTCNIFYCTNCKIKKFKLDTFLRHMGRHRKNLKLSCHICFKTFSSTLKTNRHKTSHIASSFKCDGCNTFFSNAEELNNHTKSFCKNHINRFSSREPQMDTSICLTCKKKFKNKKALSLHSVIHTERIRTHTCELCGKSFFNKRDMDRHKMLHDNNKPFQCDICKLSFRTKSKLIRHISVHSDEKPFSCEQCGKCFRLQMQLKSHSVIHTDTMPHVCSYCNKGFNFRTLLVQHIRQHTGVKPYACDICDWDFTNRSNYNKHMKRRHSAEIPKKKLISA